jgi:Uma2 family endonuclease
MSQLFLDQQQIDAPYLLKMYGFTEEDFDRMAPEMAFCELFDGAIIMPSPVNIRHQRLVRFLSGLLDGYCHRRNQGEVLCGPAVMHLATCRKFEPDVMVVRPENASRITRQQVEGPADLVIEVLSDGTRDYDLTDKAQAYRDGGVPEAIFIDDDEERIVVQRGMAPPQSILNGKFESQVLPGFWIELSWLFGESLPDPQECLKSILGG